MSEETKPVALRSRAQCNGTAVAANSGFRRTTSTPHSPKPTRYPNSAKSCVPVGSAIPETAKTKTNTPVTTQVLQALTSGKTPRMVAQELRLPLDLIDLIIEQARISGDIDFFELRTQNCTAGGACQPDPESMVCANCPILPPSIRRQQSPLGKLRRAISSHRLHKGRPITA